MNATGIVRRVDDLGRIVIPKEIRRTCKITEGDALQIYLDSKGKIILEKYSRNYTGELATLGGDIDNRMCELGVELEEIAKFRSLLKEMKTIINRTNITF